MGLLNRDAILAAQDLKTSDVNVGEWGGTVRVSMLTGTARDELGKIMAGEDAQTSYRELLVAACVVDETGARIFTFDDVKALGAKSAVALQRVFDAAQKLNAVSAAAVETAEKN